MRLLHEQRLFLNSWLDEGMLESDPSGLADVLFYHIFVVIISALF